MLRAGPQGEPLLAAIGGTPSGSVPTAHPHTHRKGNSEVRSGGVPRSSCPQVAGLFTCPRRSVCICHHTGLTPLLPPRHTPAEGQLSWGLGSPLPTLPLHRSSPPTITPTSLTSPSAQPLWTCGPLGMPPPLPASPSPSPTSAPHWRCPHPYLHQGDPRSQPPCCLGTVPSRGPTACPCTMVLAPRCPSPLPVDPPAQGSRGPLLPSPPPTCQSSEPTGPPTLHPSCVSTWTPYRSPSGEPRGTPQRGSSSPS